MSGLIHYVYAAQSYECCGLFPLVICDSIHGSTLCASGKAFSDMMMKTQAVMRDIISGSLAEHRHES